MPENKKVLKKKVYNIGVHQRDIEATERAPNRQRWNTLRNKIVLDYNSKCKIDIFEFILI